MKVHRPRTRSSQPPPIPAKNIAKDLFGAVCTIGPEAERQPPVGATLLWRGIVGQLIGGNDVDQVSDFRFRPCKGIGFFVCRFARTKYCLDRSGERVMLHLHEALILSVCKLLCVGFEVVIRNPCTAVHHFPLAQEGDASMRRWLNN